MEGIILLRFCFVLVGDLFNAKLRIVDALHIRHISRYRVKKLPSR